MTKQEFFKEYDQWLASGDDDGLEIHRMAVEAGITDADFAERRAEQMKDVEAF